MLLTKLKIICFIAILLANGVAEEATAVDLLGIAKGAETMGRGGAYLAQRSNEQAIFNNFSTLAGSEDFSATFMSSRIMNDTPLNVFSLAAGSFSFGYFGIKEFGGYVRDESNNLAEEISYYDNNIYIATGFELKPLELGVRFRQIQKGFTGVEEEGRGSAIDVSGIYRLGSTLSFGFELSNLLGSSIVWSSGTIEKLPVMMGAGVSYLPWSQLVLYADFVNDEEGLLTHMGGEYNVSEILKARIGLDQKHTSLDVGGAVAATNFTLGMGLDTGTLKMNYAYYIDGEVSAASTHYISLTYFYESRDLLGKPMIQTIEKIEEKKSLKVDSSAWEADKAPKEKEKVAPTKITNEGEDFWEKKAPQEPVPESAPEPVVDGKEVAEDFWN